jgi:hypothetical protein
VFVFVDLTLIGTAVRVFVYQTLTESGCVCLCIYEVNREQLCVSLYI